MCEIERVYSPYDYHSINEGQSHKRWQTAVTGVGGRILFVGDQFLLNMSDRLKSLVDALRSRFWIARLKLHMKRVGLKQQVRFELEGWKPKVVLDERYERFVVYGSRTVTLLGIFTSLLLIPPPFSVIISLALALLDLFFERTALMVQSMFVQPIPEKWDSDSWQGNLYHYDDRMWGVGLLFDNEEIARVALETIRAWNYDEDIDRDENVEMSFVEMNDGGYMTYLYPSDERESLREAAKAVEQEQIEKGKIREHHQNIFQMVMAQDFDNPPGSNFRTFKNHYNGGRVMLNTFTTARLVDRGSGPMDGLPDGFGGVESTDPISLKEVKITHEDELRRDSVEYQHLKYVIPLLES
ncbi:hypothetical protein [Halococcus sp. AFM35]|uniref:hypothetical protein n=1 Tax=Halococcus sp. AFM35 TaxID=3421653 RepID=UPI003EBC41D7